MIPTGNDKDVIVDRALLISSIERVGIFSEAFAMKFDFAANDLGSHERVRRCGRMAGGL